LSLKSFDSKLFHALVMHAEIYNSLLLPETTLFLLELHSVFDVISLILTRFGLISH